MLGGDRPPNVAQVRSQNDLQEVKIRSKIDEKRSPNRPEAVLLTRLAAEGWQASIFDRFLTIFFRGCWSIWGPQMEAKIEEKSIQNRYKFRGAFWTSF